MRGTRTLGKQWPHDGDSQPSPFASLSQDKMRERRKGTVWPQVTSWPMARGGSPAPLCLAQTSKGPPLPGSLPGQHQEGDPSSTHRNRSTDRNGGEVGVLGPEALRSTSCPCLISPTSTPTPIYMSLHELLFLAPRASDTGGRGALPTQHTQEQGGKYSQPEPEPEYRSSSSSSGKESSSPEPSRSTGLSKFSLRQR